MKPILDWLGAFVRRWLKEHRYTLLRCTDGSDHAVCDRALTDHGLRDVPALCGARVTVHLLALLQPAPTTVALCARSLCLRCEARMPLWTLALVHRHRTVTARVQVLLPYLLRHDSDPSGHMCHGVPRPRDGWEWFR